MRINQEKLRLNQENKRLDDYINNKKYEIEEMKGLVMRVGYELEGQVKLSNTQHKTIKVDRQSYKSKSEERNLRNSTNTQDLKMYNDSYLSQGVHSYNR